MNRKWILICVLAYIFSSPIAFGADNEPKPTDCGEIKGPGDIVKCALRVHPEARGAVYDKEIAYGLVSQARRLPNPEFEAEFSQTDNIGQTSDTVELRLMFPLEIGGNRGARIKKSKAQADLVLSESLKTKEDVVINSLLKVYRLRQVLNELELTIESLNTFRTVKGQYNRRKSLGPEQAVSLDIFSLAEADYSMRQSALEAERGELIRELSIFIGRPFKVDRKILPKFRTNWPKLPATGDPVGSEFGIARAKKRLADGELEVAKSEAWPDFAIGPTYSLETENNDEISTVGISIEMPLPVFNLNGGAKAVARAEKKKAEILERSQQVNFKNIRENLVEIYSSVTQRLKKINPDVLSQTKHRRIHKYLKRGVVGAALVIESHRQIVEFQEHTNEQELRALLALWRVRALDGELLNEINNIKNP